MNYYIKLGIIVASALGAFAVIAFSETSIAARNTEIGIVVGLSFCLVIAVMLYEMLVVVAPRKSVSKTLTVLPESFDPGFTVPRYKIVPRGETKFKVAKFDTYKKDWKMLGVGGYGEIFETAEEAEEYIRADIMSSYRWWLNNNILKSRETEVREYP